MGTRCRYYNRKLSLSPGGLEMKKGPWWVFVLEQQNDPPRGSLKIT
jgi:hypothetical protein